MMNKNYFNTLKLYLVKCWRKDRAIPPLLVAESGSIPLYLALCRAGYLLYVFIINGRLFFNQNRSDYQALSSLSYCFVPVINPLLVRTGIIKLNPKSNFSQTIQLSNLYYNE